MRGAAFASFAVLSSVLISAGCASSPPPAPATAPLATITLRQFSEFTVYAGDSIVATERVDHYADRIEGTIEVIGSARGSYVAYTTPDNRIRRLESRVLPWTGVTTTRAVDIDFRADSVIALHTAPVAYTVRRTRLGGVGPSPYIHPSPGLLEQVVLRAVRERSEYTTLDEPERIEIRVWLVDNNRTTNARVSFVSNRVVDVEMSGTRFRAWLDEFGLLMAEVPALGWLIQRRAR